MDEIRALAAHSPRPLSLQQMKSFAAAGDKLRLVSAKFLHAELQVRFARYVRLSLLLGMAQYRSRVCVIRCTSAIMELSDLPLGLNTTASVQRAVAVYCNELQLLQRMEPPTTAATDVAFTASIAAAKARGTNLVPLICSGLQELKQTDLGSNALQLVSVQEDIMHRLDTFFLARIGIRMLIGQHVESLTHVGGRVELVNVEATVKNASARAAELCRRYCGQAPGVEIHTAAANAQPAPFVYVESHLHHMVFELVKNSMRATVEYHEGLQHKQPGRLNRLERVMNPHSKGLDFVLPDVRTKDECGWGFRLSGDDELTDVWVGGWLLLQVHDVLGVTVFPDVRKYRRPGELPPIQIVISQGQEGTVRRTAFVYYCTVL